MEELQYRKPLVLTKIGLRYEEFNPLCSYISYHLLHLPYIVLFKFPTVLTKIIFFENQEFLKLAIIYFILIMQVFLIQ